MPKYPSKLLWTDLETTGLDKLTDEILEVGVVLTDMDLNEIARYSAPIKLTPLAIERIRNDKFVQDMHLGNGLLGDCKHSEKTLRDAELDIIDLLIRRQCTPGEVLLAGSGVARFDQDYIDRLMPELAQWFPYYVMDVGLVRRAAHIAAPGKEIFPKIEESFSNKAHRALADALAHLEEARGQFAVLRQLAR